LLDVTPLSLSIETLGGVATPMIPKNTTIPTAKTQVFSTAADNQTQVEVNVVQGERPMAADNKTLARFILDGIPPSPRGMPQVEVTFDIDANGILNVKAMDKASGKSQSVKIEASTALSKEEIERLKQEAAAHAAEDATKKAFVEAKNQGEALVYTSEKALRDAGDKIPADVKTAVEGKITALKTALQGSDAGLITTAMQELSTEIQKIGSTMYNQSNGPTPADNTPHEPAAE
jgi:molecular chaperone DnaK